MLFHSQTFMLLFLPFVVGLYYALRRRLVMREWTLVAASLLFYAWWDARFLPLILAQTLGSWALGELHFRNSTRWPLHLAIVANLSVLGLFKYLDFGIEIAEDITGIALPAAGLILPIGISFYTFQIISYLVDALRGNAPRYSVRHFTLFVVLFSQLIAGPIVRHHEIISQFDADPVRPGLAERLSRGLALFILAAAAKVLIADPLAAQVDPIFAAASTAVPTFSDAAAGVLGFALQIFFDFAAYSEMAIGLALMLGLTLPRNFDQPYRATSLQDFWRRWHMTLSRFLRDYVYIPMGGNREGEARYVLAAIATMGLCGLWHGAGWNFVLWGLLHGAGLIVLRFWRQAGFALPDMLGWLLTFVFAVLLFGLFRAPDLATAMSLGSALVGFGDLGRAWTGEMAALVGVAGGLALLPWTAQGAIDRWLRPNSVSAALLATLWVIVVLQVGKGQPKSFIYFQF